MALALAIVTPTAEAVSLSCDEVVAPGEQGQVGLLPGDFPLISAFLAGVLTVVAEGKQSLYACGSWFAEIEEDNVRVLVSVCEEASTIDAAEAKKKADEAEKQLAEMAVSDDGYAGHLGRYRLNRARLDAAELLR